MNDILRPGQTHRIVRAQIIIDDGTGNAHAWEITDGTANWDFTGVAGHREAARRTTRRPAPPATPRARLRTHQRPHRRRAIPPRPGDGTARQGGRGVGAVSAYRTGRAV